MKKCKKCLKDNDISEYNKQSSQKDGLNPWCKSCVKLYNSVNYLKNKEDRNLKNKLWRQENKEHDKQRNKKWIKENSQHRIQYKSKYREKIKIP